MINNENNKGATVQGSRLGSRIASERCKLNMNQAQLAQYMSETSGKGKTIQAISHWETGRRVPDEKSIKIMAQLFDVTPEYLLGFTDDPTSHKRTKRDVDILIKPEEYNNFDGKVVYIEFHNYAEINQPAIVNQEKQSFVLKNGLIKFTNPSIKAVYISEPEYINYRSIYGDFPIDMNTLYSHNQNLFWIEMISPSEAVRQRYNGWYSRNENNSFLIHRGEGFVLPFEGLNVSYHAYLRRNTIRK